MTLILRFLPAALCLLMLGAHFFRFGLTSLVLLSVAAVGLLFVRRSWARRVVQLLLGSGVLVWIVVLLNLVMHRQQRGEPWTRLALILGGVAAFNLVAALLLQGRGPARWFLPPVDLAAASADSPAAADG